MGEQPPIPITDLPYPPRPIPPQLAGPIRETARAPTLTRHVSCLPIRCLFLAFIGRSFVAYGLLERVYLAATLAGQTLDRRGVPSPQTSMDESKNLPPSTLSRATYQFFFLAATVQSLASTKKDLCVDVGRRDRPEWLKILRAAAHPVLLRSASPCHFRIGQYPTHHALR